MGDYKTNEYWVYNAAINLLCMLRALQVKLLEKNRNKNTIKKVRQVL